MVALSVALLGVTGCGGSSSARPTAAAPDPAAATAPGSSTTSVSTGGGSGSGGDNIARDIAAEHKASEAALRVWGKTASGICRRLRSRHTDDLSRLKAMVPKGRKFTASEQKRFGARFTQLARHGEKEYAALQDIALPKQVEALEKIHSFFDKVEEDLTLGQRFGIEVAERHSLPDMLGAILRLKRLRDDYKRDARAVKAPRCAVWPDDLRL